MAKKSTPEPKPNPKVLTKNKSKYAPNETRYCIIPYCITARISIPMIPVLTIPAVVGLSVFLK
ncbi:hypothetical protein D3C86_1200960 [compost metagenome]